ncbi:unnamed protein product [Ilex paraguariensis]|uniref:Protein kinase domain-containing protein n=1 Tax=Ilex paraguariensis TaxID=185542 RepID=A0ABC8TW18_9AQUA
MISYSPILPLLFTLFVSFLSAIDSDLVADRAALLRLSSAVGGITRFWDLNNTTCSWVGVTCDAAINRVTELRLPGDGLRGQVPVNSIGNLTQLRVLSLRRNSLSGALPSDLGSCVELRNLILHENDFSGGIPASLFGLNNLLRLDLAGNNFVGEISPEFNNLTRLRTLYLENNQLTGSLPQLENLSSLREFNVSFNRLNGSIPSRLGRFSTNSFLGNSLCGSPLDSCSNGGNKLSGGAIAGIVIGSVIGFLLVILILFILWRKYRNGEDGRRVVTSPFPPSPVKLPEHDNRRRRTDIVRENHEFDNGFSNMAAMRVRVGNVVKNRGNDGMVSFGDGAEVLSLEDLLTASAEVLGRGTVGTTYKAYLEGGIEVVVKRLKNVVVSEREFRENVEALGALVHENLVPLRAYYYGRDEKLIVYESMPMGSLAALLHGSAENGEDGRRVVTSPFPPSPVKLPEHDNRRRRTDIVRENHEFDNGFSNMAAMRVRVGNVVKNRGNDGMVSFGDGAEVLILEDLLTASAEVLGRGTVGTTYKAYLEGGIEVVVKRLKNVVVSEREFRENVEALGALVHENLVPLRAYYYGRDEKLIVYESMPMGSLAALLHGSRSSYRAPLSWEVRSRIAFEVACGIEYLHSLDPNASHGNIKASNIFLADNYRACISEFGIAQLVSSTSSPNLIGYQAPEVLDSRKVSQKADIYCFGILLLELLTGKAPTDALNEEGVDLPRWVQSVAEEKWTIDVFDPELLGHHYIEDQLVKLLHLAIYCTSKHLDKRPSIGEVTSKIKEICGSRQQELQPSRIEVSY